MELASLNAKKLRIGIANGDGYLELCRKYDCTEDELTTKINHLYNHNKKDAEEIISNLVSNDKKKKKLKRDDQKAELKELSKKENRSCISVMEMEKKHADLCTERGEYTSLIREIVDEMSKIKILFKEKAEKCRDYAEKRNQILEQMHQLNSDLSVEREKLKNIRAEIRDKTTISLSVIDETIYYLEEETEIEFTDDHKKKAENIFTDLICNTECENYSIKNLRIVSRLFAFSSSIDKKIEVIFEDFELEAIYKHLKMIIESETSKLQS